MYIFLAISEKLLILLIFAGFFSVTYKLFAVFIYYICGFTKEFIALGSLASNALPYQLRPDCQSGVNPFNIARVIAV